jgi:cell division protein FtsB
VLGFLSVLVKGNPTRTASQSGTARPVRRPTAHRTTASTTQRRFQRRGGGRFTGRAAILALVVSAIVLTLAYPLREYLAQRAKITAAERAQQKQRGVIADLEAQKRRWDDPAYVKAQARKRLGMVEPGVLVYHIEYDEKTGALRGPGSGGLRPRPADANAPWYSQLWTSLRVADQPADVLPADAPVLRGQPKPGPSSSPAR